ncbi:hypothetical protein ES707_11586 [subsurface metagenome]
MNRHLVAIKIGIKGGTYQRVYLDGATINQHRFKSLDTKPVQSRRPVKQNRPLLDNLLKDIVDLGLSSLHQPTGTLYVGGQPLQHQAVHNKGFEQFQSHPPGQTALMKLEFWANNND